MALTHVHGLSYSDDGKRLLIPSHHGLAVFSDGRWSKAQGAAHDYMGFSATRGALYSSGHPAPGSGQINPFGLIKSQDGGRTWKNLGLEGESDFHLMASGYENQAVYVLNAQPNSRMSQTGIHYTLTDGLKWQRAAARGLGPKVNSLAVHPTDPAVVAAGTDDGLYLSRDSAGHFESLVDGRRVLASSFDLAGQHLWFSTYAGAAALEKVSLQPEARPEMVSIPSLSEDAVAYIAHNPSQGSEIAIATFKRSVFVSRDDGRTWTRIARDGVVIETAR
ncbi:MAG: F510_1955 family glycosylhydrolase [Lautropia sp.]